MEKSRSTTILDKNVEKAHNQQDSEKSKGEEDDSNNTVPFYKLFAFADSTDVFLMIVGTVAAVANGVAFPLMALLMGEVVNAFGGTANNHDVVEKVSKVGLDEKYQQFIYKQSRKRYTEWGSSRCQLLHERQSLSFSASALILTGDIFH